MEGISSAAPQRLALASGNEHTFGRVRVVNQTHLTVQIVFDQLRKRFDFIYNLVGTEETQKKYLGIRINLIQIRTFNETSIEIDYLRVSERPMQLRSRWTI